MPKIEQEYPLVYARDRAEWRAWLESNYTAVPGVFLVIYKKGSGQPSVSYAEAVEEALCFGWIDSRANTIDAERYRQIFTPRNPKSGWSKSNKIRVERLIAEGRMTPAGMQIIAEAQRSGAWSALDASEELRIPPDLQAAIDADPEAARHFAAFPDSVKKMFIRRVENAKRPETRQKRLAEMVALAAQNITPFTWTPASKKTE